MKYVISSVSPACFSVQVASGEVDQLKISQRIDLEIHVTGEGRETLSDEFDLGDETVTLNAAGAYRVEVRSVKQQPRDVTFSASMQLLPLRQTAARQQAEEWATASKRSKKIDDINKSLNLWIELGDTASIARTYLKRGSALRADNDLTAARADDERALELCRAISDTRCSAEAANNSGVDSLGLRDVDRASQRMEEAAQDWQKLHDSLYEAITRSNLGELLRQSGDFKRAISTLDQAGEVQRHIDALGYSKVLNNLGLCYQSLAEYEKARGYFERAVAGFVRSQSPKDLVLARLNLGRTYMLEGHLLHAQSVLEHVLAEANELSFRRAIADSLRNLGQTLWRRGSVEQARSRFQEALAMDQTSGDRRGQSSALHYLGLVAQHNGDLSAARNFFLHAVQLRHESGLPDDAAESLSALAGLEYGEGRLDAAHDYAEQALKLLESVRSQVSSPALRASFYSRKREFFDLLVDMAMAPGGPQSHEEGLLAAERGRGRSLMDLLAGGSLLQQLPQDLARRRSSIQRRIDYLVADLSALPPEQQDGIRQQIQLLVAEDEAVEAQIRESVGSQKLGQPFASIAEIQRDYLPASSALLEYHLGARKSYLWLVDSQQVRAYALPRAGMIEAEAALVVEDYGRILERRRSPARQAEFVRALKNLSKTLLGQLSGIPLPKLLILVPDGVLHRVPLAALKLPATSMPLGLAHDLVQVPSAAYLTFGRQPRPVAQFPQAILAVADPVFSQNDPRVPRDQRKVLPAKAGSSLVRLPFMSEIDTMESLVPAHRRKVLRGFDASRATLDKLRLADFGILHFSTHALIDDRIPELSRLALSMVDRFGRPVNGFLLPYQLAQFHLDGSIVVLSACDTALGKQVLGEGLAGLTSSLLYAGGAQLVLTLTKVDAEASSRFLNDVYRRFLPGSASMEHSITLTRRALARSPQFSDPYYWASFIVIGRPADMADVVKSDLRSSYN